MESESPRGRPSVPWSEPGSLLGLATPLVTARVLPWLRRYWSKLLVMGVGLAAVVVAGNLGSHAFDAQRDPVPVVKAYLDAIARGDATSANHIFRPVEDLKDSPLLSDEALGAATERIKVRSVELQESDTAVEDPAKDAVVLAKFSLAGEEYEQTFELQAEDQGLAGPDEWQIETPLLGVAQIWKRATTLRP